MKKTNRFGIQDNKPENEWGGIILLMLLVVLTWIIGWILVKLGLIRVIIRGLPATTFRTVTVYYNCPKPIPETGIYVSIINEWDIWSPFTSRP